MNNGKRLVVLASMLLATLAASAETPIRLRLAHEGTSAARPNTVITTLSNHTDHDLFIYTYNTAFALPDGRTTGNWFTIKDMLGNDVRYKGRFVVSGAPSPSEYTRVRPGSSVSGSVDLSLEYELPSTGHVTVSTWVAVYERMPMLLANGEPEDIPHILITSNELSFVLGRTASGAADPTSIVACTPAQQSDISSAISAAQSTAEEAAHFLSSLYYTDPFDPANPVPPRTHMTPHPRYQNWFGVWDDAAPQWPPESDTTDNTRVDRTVIGTYARLLGGATAVCDQCAGYHPTTRAWAEGRLIHLCPANFSDPITGGITSQAGTIAHEVSHQDDEMARGTVDLPGVTNRASAHALPRSAAVTSAANYEYFMTNTPLGRGQPGSSVSRP